MDALYEQLDDRIRLSGGLARLEGEHYVDYVARDVWPSESRTAFFLQAPLESIVLRFVCGRYDPSPDGMIDFFCTCVDHGADVPRLACGLVHPLCKLAGRANVTSLCNLLRRFALHEEARPMILEPSLFRMLAARMRADRHVIDVVSVVKACGDLDPRVFESVVARCARILLTEFVQVRCLEAHPGLSKALWLLTSCASRAEWRVRLIVYVVDLARHAWPAPFGPLVAAMLGGTSVELVVRLHAASRLVPLCHAANEHVADGGAHALAWRAVRAHLRRHWPRVDQESDASHSAHVCPITLHPCIDPVVASDGHTYERDAIVEHMARNGLVSPTTREPLEYHLFPNRAMGV